VVEGAVPDEVTIKVVCVIGRVLVNDGRDPTETGSVRGRLRVFLEEVCIMRSKKGL